MYQLNRIIGRNTEAILGVVKHMRFNSGRQFSSKIPDGIASSGQTSTSSSGYPMSMRPADREINLFGPRDPRTPFPGNVGTATLLYNASTPKNDHLGMDFLNPMSEEPDVITSETNSERHARVIDHVLYPNENCEEEKLIEAQEILECVAHSCPQLLCRDFQDLFPGRDLGKNVTVITICQKTKSDQKSWSPEMDDEREELMHHFVTLSQMIVTRLSEAGFWADYIDPFSGRPYISPVTNDTLFETDERYRNFGFEIQDMGCCKIISHHSWGTRAFVGSLFTNAPLDSPELIDVMHRLSES